MADLPILRSDEKLPRGSYFFIQVGHRFYAGEQAETIDVEVSNQSTIVRYYNKDGRPSDELAQRWAESRRGYPYRRGSNGARFARDCRKGTLASYAKPLPRVEKTVKKEFTGKRHPILVDSLAEAKQYRSRDKVNSACKRLEACYEGLDVKVTIKIEKGESQ